MSEENSFTISGGTSPFTMSSAKPEMEVSGVFSSCDTLAENSRRRRSCSVLCSRIVCFCSPMRCSSGASSG